MAIGTASVTSGTSPIQLLNEPGVLIEPSPGAGVNFVASVHAPGQTTILEAIFTANNVALNAWTVVPLDANGNATIPVHFTASGEYLNLATADTLSNTVSFPVVIGDTVAATTTNEQVTISTGDAKEIFATVPIGVQQSGGAATLISSAGHLTDNATGGTQLIFDSKGGSVINEAATSEFVGNPSGGVSTITASAGGSDTIFAGGPVVYNGTNGANSLFVGGSGAVSVVSAANEIAFGSTAGGTYQVGSGSFFFFGVGGADTITGGTANPTVWGNTNEDVTITNTAQKGIFYAFGNNDTINAMGAGGGNSFVVVNEALPTSDGTFAGNTTLVGSNAGSDVLVLQSYGGAAPPAHTITMENWQSSDAVFMGGYSAADIATANSALAAAGASGGATFTLSDNTTIDFVNAHPTQVFS